jgi:hypothetical protein
MTRFLETLPKMKLDGVQRIQSAPLADHLFVMAEGATGRVRLDGSGAPAPLGHDELAAALHSRLSFPIARLTWLTRPDAYDYDGYEQPADLPAYRADLDDRARTTLYLDPVSGRIVRAVDDVQRLSRWTRVALHDWDFPGLRQRPIWDLVVALLLIGVTLTCALGGWLGIRRIVRDLSAGRSTRRLTPNHASPRANEQRP